MTTDTSLAEQPVNRLAVVGDSALAIPTSSHSQNPWPIAAGDLNGVIEKLELPDNQAAALRWLRDFGFHNRKSLADVAKLIGYDKNTVYKILTGKHGARLDNFTQEVEAFRAKVERSTTKNYPFTETETGAFINEVCDLAISSGRIVFLVGPSHCGKSANLGAYPKRHPYGLVNCVRMNAGGHAHQFKLRLGSVKGISNSYRVGDISERVIKAVEKDTLLIVDEFQETIPEYCRPRAATISYVREIHDMTGVPIVLAMHNEDYDRMKAGHQQLFKPLLNRALDPIYLPAEPSVRDLNAYAARIGLPPAIGPAADLQKTVTTTKSLGSWLTLLLRGVTIAKNRREPLAWDHVLRADRILANGGKPK